jgi:hypothetical protein
MVRCKKFLEDATEMTYARRNEANQPVKMTATYQSRTKGEIHE